MQNSRVIFTKEFKVYEEANRIKEAYDPVPGKYYRSVYGDRLKCVSGNRFKFVSKTPLVAGEFFSDLTDKQLTLFINIERKAGRYGF